MLLDHVGHPDREVGLAVMRALAAFGASGTSTATGPPTSPRRSSGRISNTRPTRCARWSRSKHEPAATLQNAALRDELELIRQRVLAAFSMRHATEGFDRVVFQLAQRDPRSHALALEWLDVTLDRDRSRRGRVARAPAVGPRATQRALAHVPARAARAPHEILLELVQDRDGRWRRPWVKACALYTASGISTAELDATSTAAVAELTELGADEDQIVHETLAGIRHRRLDLV